MNIENKIAKIYYDYIRPGAILGGAMFLIGVVGKVVYDRTIRDDPEVYKGFPKHFEPTKTTIFSPNGGKVKSDIIYVEMLPEETYKLFNVDDTTIAYEGQFKYEIRPNSAGIFSTGYGTDIRYGRVEGIKR